MRRIISSILLALAITCIYAQNHTEAHRQMQQPTLHQVPYLTNSAPEEEDEFIFSPQGEERMYVMTLYSYDQTNSKFVRAQSLKSQVRYDKDGKTVYFKDLTRSLNAITWTKGEISVATEEDAAHGINSGDTIINIPYGQPLVYYKNKYLVFFCPMIYNDNTGDMEAQDNYTLIVRGDSLVQPTFPEGYFQGASGYVVVSSTTQGFLSMDIDHGMRLERRPFIEVPEEIAPVEYVYAFTNSYGNIYKKKVNVKKQGNDIYMQLSTSAPNAYVKGAVNGNVIEVESPQVITDSTFIYYYSLADPVYENGELSDFIPTSANRLRWDETTHTISSVPGDGMKDVFSVDYLDGMSVCMDYVTNPILTVYPGDAPATPMNPIWRSLKLDSEVTSIMTYNYMSFVIPALDVDSNYINPDYLKYRIYINDSLYTFKPSTYMNLKKEMTDVPTTFAEGFDFYTYDQLHYVYLYMEQKDVTSIGIQSVYTVNGEERCSQIEWKRFDTSEDPNDTRSAYDLALTSCRVKDVIVKAGENVVIRGEITNNGKNDANGFTISYGTDDESKTEKFTSTIASGKAESFELLLTASSEIGIGQSIPVNVRVTFADETLEEDLSDNAATVHYGIYSENFTSPTLLLEEFTSESCGWCPYGAYRIHTAIEESELQKDAIWVCHHEGYGVDWLTVDASTEYTALYGGNTFAPAWMLNRDQKYADEPYPVFGIGEVDEVKTILNEAMQNPCFVKLNVSNTYADGMLTTQICAEKSPVFDVQCPKAYLSVYLVEDSIRAKKQKTYDSHTISYHHNALRDVLTPIWGEPLSWKGQEAANTYTFQIPDEYNIDNLSIVAFVHEMNDDVNQRRIYNAAQASVQIAVADAIRTNAEEEMNDNRIFNLQGQEVKAGYKGIIVRKGKVYDAGR